MIVSDGSYASAHGKTKHQLWMELCDLISKHPQDIRSVQVGGWRWCWCAAHPRCA